MKRKYLGYLSLAFFSGIHGFALFAPYAAVVMAVDLTIRKLKPTKLSDVIEQPLVEDDDVLQASPL